MKPPTQITMLLTPNQYAKIERIVRQKKKNNALAKKSQVLREILDAGLEAYDKK
jgi:hypothetical protein